MGKKHKRNKIEPKKVGWFPKLRPFLFPILFGMGAVGAYFINTNDLMNKVQTGANVGVQITWVVEVCTYLCVIGLIVLGYQFESKLEKRNDK
jgi:hypothetical protein